MLVGNLGRNCRWQLWYGMPINKWLPISNSNKGCRCATRQGLSLPMVMATPIRDADKQRVLGLPTSNPKRDHQIFGVWRSEFIKITRNKRWISYNNGLPSFNLILMNFDRDRLTHVWPPMGDRKTKYHREDSLHWKISYFHNLEVSDRLTYTLRHELSCLISLKDC